MLRHGLVGLGALRSHLLRLQMLLARREDKASRLANKRVFIHVLIAVLQELIEGFEEYLHVPAVRGVGGGWCNGHVPGCARLWQRLGSEAFFSRRLCHGRIGIGSWLDKGREISMAESGRKGGQRSRRVQ